MAAAAEKLITTSPEKPPSNSTKQPISGLRQVLLIRCTMPEKRTWVWVAALRTPVTELHRLSSTSSVVNTASSSDLVTIMEPSC
ncbi:hypothetical protein D3C84_876320 [compost metagenome]